MQIVTGQNHMREERPSATFQFELGPQVDTATEYADTNGPTVNSPWRSKVAGQQSHQTCGFNKVVLPQL